MMGKEHRPEVEQTAKCVAAEASGPGRGARGRPSGVCVCGQRARGPEINDSTGEPDTSFTLRQMPGPSSLHPGEGVCACL